ncbi:MAG: hypothetical protein A2798_03975 [Candidatus Levybacteria bacterium RIFCSPHIGHO2_01_FULL_37_17]|nr:MAG: hypothetical protein A2798_03975 [Candidatus Levybacteria bacterium RIFCSPHIGHO2_01_FULL_37_17]OGH36626.1 MAG: hypothetical protein A2959_04030 [Candidatus Levybacteria bacterium RIFCSPLOWO2_01_FULL_38_23]
MEPNSENLPKPPQLEIQPRSRFRTGIELMIKPVVKSPKVEGLDHLKEINPGERAIFATSHLSDTDPVIGAAIISKFRQVDLASLQTNQEAFGFALNLIGRERFHNVANTFDNEKMMPRTSFEPTNYEEMKQAMEQGRDVVIAAHKPSRDWRLPDNAGVGDVYLAHLTDAPVIPVAVDIHSETQAGMAAEFGKTIRRALSGKRPEVTVRIGAPIKFDKIDPNNLKDAGMILMGKRDELRQDEARYQKALTTYEVLRQQSEQVLSAISQMLPPEKRSTK